MDKMTTLFENDKISIHPVDPRLPEITAMIADLDEYQATLYPPESNHLVDVEKLAGKAYYFIAGYEAGRPLAIASFKREAAYVEIKRLYVPEQYRGRKLALRLMNDLEKKAISEGYPEARLETGIHQHEAIALYKKLGYTTIEPFGAYIEDPLSVFMGKKL
jgi:putative acetyltransferase